MKKLKEFLEAVLLIFLILIDGICLPIQKLFSWEIFQLTEKYLKFVTKRELNKHYEN